MTAYQLVLSAPALVDLEEIKNYLVENLHAPQAAFDLMLNVREHILKLKQMPNRYTLVFDERLARQGIRKIPVNNYLIFYRVDEQTQSVIIVRVLFGSRNWESLL